MNLRPTLGEIEDLQSDGVAAYELHTPLNSLASAAICSASVCSHPYPTISTAPTLG